MSDITKQSLTKLVENIKNKKLSSTDVTKAFIDRSEKSEELNAYITNDFTSALDKAKEFDQKPNFDICFIVLRSILICYLNMRQSIT